MAFALQEGTMPDLRRLLRFRSPERNRETDARRLALIRRVVRSAIADAEAETKGLRARIAKARRSAIFLVAQSDDGKADPSHHADLTRLEPVLRAAEDRLAQLKEHLAHLRKLESATTRLPRLNRRPDARKAMAE
jgi:hypothetical protein